MKIFNVFIFSLISAVLFLGSCADFFNPPAANFSGGTVQIFLEPLNLSLSDDEILSDYSHDRTLMPASSNGRYEMVFTSTQGKTVTSSQSPSGPNNSISVMLDGGNWTAVVTRFEGNIPVATGTKSFTVNSSGNTAVDIPLTPVPGGTGSFSYKVLSTVSASAKISIVPVSNGIPNPSGALVLIPALGTQYSFPLSTGDYDVYVSLETPDGRKAGKYSAVRIYSGLTTSTLSGSTEFFDFKANHFVNYVNIAVKINGVNIINSGIDPATVVIRALNYETDGFLADTGVVSYSAASSNEQFIRISPVPKIYFQVVVKDTSDDEYVYTMKGNPENIGFNGKDGITITPTMPD